MPNYGEGAKGAAGGAMTGAAAGSVFGPYGTAIGAVGGGLIGGAMGMFGGDDKSEAQRRYEEWLREVQSRPTPQIGGAALAENSDMRGRQVSLVDALEAQSSGRGPSLAAETAKAMSDRGSSQQRGIAAGARGSNAGIASFVAANNSGRIAAQSGQDAMLGRIQEQYNARNQLGLTLHGMRGADESTSKFNAGQQNEIARANLEAELRKMGLGDAAIGQILQSQTQISQMPSQGDQLLAGGAGAIGSWAQQRAGQGVGGQGTSPASQPYTPYGDNTMNPFAGGAMGNSTMNPFSQPVVARRPVR